ncbi:hypothetical protein ABW20_dc0103385 [Dactylellina cionopaga]|nr:hypothetical protein ABW20_dc0103385 [Dactylellina cionopaga]
MAKTDKQISEEGTVSLRVNDATCPDIETDDKPEERFETDKPKAKKVQQDPTLVERFGPHYDENLIYLLISPRALAWELLNLNNQILPIGDERRPENPWHVPMGDPREQQPMYKKKYMLVDRSDFAKMSHLGIQAVTEEVSIPVEDIAKNSEDDEYLKDMDVWFARERRREERNRLRKAGLSADDSTSEEEDDKENFCIDRTDVDYANIMIEALKKEDPNWRQLIHSSDEDEEHKNSSSSVTVTPRAQDSSKRLVNPVLYNLPNIEDKKESESSALFMGRVVRCQLELARSTGGFEKIPPWHNEILAFHDQRIAIHKQKRQSSMAPNCPIRIAINLGRPLDTNNIRLFTPLKSKSPEVRIWLERGQNELQYMLDMMRGQWTRLQYLDYYDDPEYRKLYDKFGHDPKNQDLKRIVEKNPVIHTYDNMTPQHTNVIKLAAELFCEDLSLTLDMDLCELLEFAIYRYISATPADDIQMREALLILWEIKMVGPMLTADRPEQKEPCSCYSRHHLERNIRVYGADGQYLKLFTKDCVKDHPIVSKMLEECKFTSRIPGPLGDISVEEIGYGGHKVFLPTWMVTKHKLIPLLARELRVCFIHNKDCHGSDRDHAELLMKAIWGSESILESSNERPKYAALYGEVRSVIVEKDETKFRERDETLGKLMLEYDLKQFIQRQNWRLAQGEPISDPFGLTTTQTNTDYVTKKAAEILGTGFEKIGEWTGNSMKWRLTILGWRKKENMAEKARREIEKREAGMQVIIAPGFNPQEEKRKLAKAQRRLVLGYQQDMITAMRRENKNRKRKEETQKKKRDEEKGIYKPGSLGKTFLSTLKEEE